MNPIIQITIPHRVHEVPFHPCRLGAYFGVHCVNSHLSQCNNTNVCIKIQYLISEISLRLRIFSSNFMKNTYFFALGRGPYTGAKYIGTKILADFGSAIMWSSKLH